MGGERNSCAEVVVAWDEFKVMQAKINPLSKAQFWKNLAENYFAVVLGYDIDDYKNGVKKAIEAMEKCASQLEQMEKDPENGELDGGKGKVGKLYCNLLHGWLFEWA